MPEATRCLRAEGELLRKSNLKGLQIPGKIECLIATFFADNTTVYLSKEDDFGSLQHILDQWCTASGAKFNINKTEIIPIGSFKHQEKLRQVRYLNGEDGTQVHGHIKIAREGEAIRTLGALIGNGISQIKPWTKVIEKIDCSLEQWNQSKPTMEGRRLIISMVVGGMTQYLTKVQGMPKEIEKKLTKRIQGFLWNGKTHVCINAETVEVSFEYEGHQILDILARNKAIMVRWLHTYLDMSPERATWTYVADALIAHHTPKTYENIDDFSKINIFLQSWNTDSRKLPKDLQDMITVAKRHGLHLDGLAFSRNISREMPVWLHSESKEMK
ncbi:hypothetical protein EV368DRAFT_76512 [Lentinula lateritia]|nr:hypothetical protein EV368DRAFT_76512 [Lentinula lateritia]